MKRHTDVDLSLESWLAEGPSQLPGHVIDGIVRQLEQTKQRKPGWLPGRQEMNRTFLAVGGIAAAVALVIVAGAMVLGLNAERPGVGGQPSPTSSPRPTVAVAPSAEPTSPPTASPPTASPPPSATPRTYAAQPLPAPNDSLTLTVTLPEGWTPDWLPGLLIPDNDRFAPPDGMFFLFDDVTTLNGDPCNWSGTADDVSVGPEVDDLVDALVAQTAYGVSDAVDVTIGGYDGKRVDIVHPTEPYEGETSNAPECDEGNYRLWSTAAHGPTPIYGQGPANRWQTNILDVDGTRLVIVVADYPGTSSDDRAEMEAIIDSIAIEP